MPSTRRRAGRARPDRGATSLGRLQEIVSLQRTLLDDRRRNAAFREAIAGRITPGCTVLDIGAGTGVWAITAARLGAARVVAVEQEPLLQPVIERLAHENGVADRVEVRVADSRRLRLSRRFDLVISETVGNEGLEEGIVEILRDAHRRFLKPGGHLLPEALALMAVPVRRPRPSGPDPSLAWARDSFDGLAVHFSSSPGGGGVRPLAEPAVLLTVPLGTGRGPTPLSDMRASWTLPAVRRVEAIAVFVVMHLGSGTSLSTLSGTHWSPILHGIEPFDVGKGRLDFELSLENPARRWRVVCTNPRGREERHYSPLFAYGAVKSAVRSVTLATP
jgi:SAM-dependent methyltransferase